MKCTKDFITTNFESKETFLWAMARAMASTKIDAFDFIRFTWAHWTIAHYNYLTERIGDKASYGLLWNMSLFLEEHTQITDSQAVIFKDLLEYFELQELPTADLVEIWTFGDIKTLTPTSPQLKNMADTRIDYIRFGSYPLLLSDIFTSKLSYE